MPTLPIHPPAPGRSWPHGASLPGLLRTPLGYALLELQGTINFPEAAEEVRLGRVAFPDYDAATGAQEGAWMRKVYLYVGHQRMTGEVQKLKTPLGLLQKRAAAAAGTGERAGTEGVLGDPEAPAGSREELEISEVLYYKIVFRSRPEPVGLSGD